MKIIFRYFYFNLIYLTIILLLQSSILMFGMFDCGEICTIYFHQTIHIFIEINLLMKEEGIFKIFLSTLLQMFSFVFDGYVASR